MLSIYIGKEKIKILDGVYSGKVLKIKNAVYQPIVAKEENSDKSDLIVPTIFNCLNDLRIPSRTCKLVIDDATSLYRELVVPKTGEKNLKQIVTNEMAQILSDTSNYVIDYTVAHEFLYNQKSMCKLSITAIQKTVVEKYLDIAKKARLKVECMDVCNNAFTRLMGMYGNFLSELPYVLIDVEDTFVNFVLFDQGMRILSRSVDYSSLGSSVDIATSMLSGIADNVSRMMQFQMTQKNKKPVARLYITGIIPKEVNVEKHLATKFNLGIGVLPKPPFINGAEGLNINHFSNVIGGLL